MNDNNNFHDKKIKRNVGLIDLLDLTEEELETYTEFLQNVYDDSRIICTIKTSILSLFLLHTTTYRCLLPHCRYF